MNVDKFWQHFFQNEAEQHQAVVTTTATTIATTDTATSIEKVLDTVHSTMEGAFSELQETEALLVQKDCEQRQLVRQHQQRQEQQQQQQQQYK